VCTSIAERAGLRAERYLFGKMKVGVVMVTLQGRLLGMNEVAREIGEKYHWHLPEQEKKHE
ncbi:MAG TPA: cobalamin biosynthesis protein CbiD, partial [Mitsuokella multacida]|nr:cobalamin biosynthesis protein CbiD [Mitsuokella multacida]